MLEQKHFRAIGVALIWAAPLAAQRPQPLVQLTTSGLGWNTAG